MTSPPFVLLSDLKLKIFAPSYRHGPGRPYSIKPSQPTVVNYLKLRHRKMVIVKPDCFNLLAP